MQQYLLLPTTLRLKYLNMASIQSGVSRAAIERDWWQGFVLKNIFKLPFAEALTLHGSKSMSTH